MNENLWVQDEQSISEYYLYDSYAHWILRTTGRKLWGGENRWYGYGYFKASPKKPGYLCVDSGNERWYNHSRKWEDPAIEMAQPIKATVTKPDDRNLILGFYTIERENQLSQVVL